MVTFPRADFFDLCKISDTTFWPMARQEISRTAGGVSQGKDLGSPLWRASFTSAPQSFADAAAIEAALISLNGVVGSFLAHDVRRPFPIAYPDGVFNDNSTIGTLYPADAFGLALTGLDPNFQLKAGDYLSFAYGARPNIALHMVMVGVAADGVGNTAKFEVFPAIRPGAVAGAAVTLKRAPCEMSLEPGQSPPGIREMTASAVSFSGFQIIE